MTSLLVTKRALGTTNTEIAEVAGYCEATIKDVLTGRSGSAQTKADIAEALERILAQIKAGQRTGEQRARHRDKRRRGV